uniref:Transposase n=1 Tax=Steinernema glaseri TaxID=37863 RepID=A0A1I7YW34_9BILA
MKRLDGTRVNVPPRAPYGNELQEVRKADLETNAFRLRFDQMRKVFQHEMAVYGVFIRQRQRKDVDLLRAAKNE